MRWAMSVRQRYLDMVQRACLTDETLVFTILRPHFFEDRHFAAMIEKEKRKYLFEVKKRHRKGVENNEIVQQNKSGDSFLGGLMSMMCFASDTTTETRDVAPTASPVLSQGIQNQTTRDESVFEKTMDCIAFPEQHLACNDDYYEKFADRSSSLMEQSTAVAQRQQTSFPKMTSTQTPFEDFMDVVAFPEKHTNCQPPPLPETLGCHHSKTFEETMDVIAFPERHISCPDPGRVDSSFDSCMNVVAFPEKHITCAGPHPSTVQSHMPSRKQRSHWKYGALEKKSRANGSIARASSMFPEHGKGDVVRSPYTRSEKAGPAISPGTYIQRSDRILDREHAPVNGDILVLEHELPIRREASLEQKQKIHAILDNREGSDTLDYVFGSVESFTCKEESAVDDRSQLTSEYDKYRSVGTDFRRDRSLISESSISTTSVWSTRGSRQDDPVHVKKGEGMELILEPVQPPKKSRPSKKESKKKKNRVNPFMSSSNKRKQSLSTQSRRALGV